MLALSKQQQSFGILSATIKCEQVGSYIPRGEPSCPPIITTIKGRGKKSKHLKKILQCERIFDKPCLFGMSPLHIPHVEEY